jgi:hypothetical protein
MLTRHTGTSTFVSWLFFGRLPGPEIAEKGG